MSKDLKDKPMGHSYDGIQEYDNPLPTWWTNFFWGTIIFSIGYSAYYLTGWGPTIPEEYEIEAARLRTEASAQAALVAKSAPAPVDATAMLIAAARDAQRVAAGQAVFAAKCVACHSQGGEGLIGPNLTDQFWIHGGTLPEIYKVVQEGVLDKGMIAWKDVLSEQEIVDVVSYVRSLQGTNKPGKAPQGNAADPTPLG